RDSSRRCHHSRCSEGETDSLDNVVGAYGDSEAGEDNQVAPALKARGAPRQGYRAPGTEPHEAGGGRQRRPAPVLVRVPPLPAARRSGAQRPRRSLRSFCACFLASLRSFCASLRSFCASFLASLRSFCASFLASFRSFCASLRSSMRSLRS